MEGQTIFIWVGIDVDEQFSQLKQRALTVEKEVGITRSALTIPLHISLKISFEIPLSIYENVVADIIAIYQETPPFSIDVEGLACEDVILWVRMKDCLPLRVLHDKLNQTMLSKYGVPLHPYDTDYKFHTTLYMENDSEKLKEAYNKLKDMPIPTTLVASPFLIGSSPNGAFGTYQVRQWIPASSEA